MEPDDEFDISFRPTSTPRTTKKNNPRSYQANLLRELRDFNGPRYKFGLLLIPLRHAFTYLMLLFFLLLFLFIVGTILIKIILPSDYSGTSFDIVYAVFFGYVAFSISIAIFVWVSWIRVCSEMLCCRKGINVI